MNYIQVFHLKNFEEFRKEFLDTVTISSNWPAQSDYDISDSPSEFRPERKPYYKLVKERIHPILKDYCRTWGCENYNIESMWFHAYNEGGDYPSHTHTGANLTGVITVDLNRPEEATQIFGSGLQLPVGSVVLFPSMLPHRSPVVTGRKIIIGFNWNMHGTSSNHIPIQSLPKETYMEKKAKANIHPQMKDVQSLYDNWGSYEQNVKQFFSASHVKMAELVNRLDLNLDELDVAEIGQGSGLLAKELYPDGVAPWDAYDISETMCNQSRPFYKSVTQHDICYSELPKTYDVIFMCGVFAFGLLTAECVPAIVKSLKPNGYLIASFPAMENFWAKTGWDKVDCFKEVECVEPYPSWKTVGRTKYNEIKMLQLK
jgi:hypothetical protein